jgi:precorrin-2 dehydrogenase/sirohydrochlorin ferrochelatase
MLAGEQFNALVVGGGSVAARKVARLIEGGVKVTVIAPEIASELADLAAAHGDRVTLIERRYARSDVKAGMLVIAATDDRSINESIGRDARGLGALVNVVDDPEAGNFITPSVHRSGDLVIAVSTGRVPAAAAAIRADIGRRFDGRYATAISALRTLRDRLLGAGRRDEWKRASRELIADDFCNRVEQGTVEPQVTSWR